MGKGFIAFLTLIGLVPFVVSQNDALFNMMLMSQLSGGGGMFGRQASTSNQGGSSQGQGSAKSSSSGASQQTTRPQINPLLLFGMAGGNDNLLALGALSGMGGMGGGNNPCSRAPFLCYGQLMQRR